MNKCSWLKLVCNVVLFCVATSIASPAQTLKTLVTFNGTNGAAPERMSLVQGTDGNLYGTTSSGGAHNRGIVFKMTPTGVLTTLYSFCSKTDCADGETPSAGLVLATDGNFYGTTYQGGAYDYGSVFKITPTGELTTLHSFDYTDGEFPSGALVQATNGNFYGTTSQGGAQGYGTVFEITPEGTFTSLHSFDAVEDGLDPNGALIQATDGNFYGTTNNFGPNDGDGTVFKITSTGVLTTLFSFDGVDGGLPAAGLVQAADGNFYGTTSDFGSHGGGTVFKMTPAGTLSTLYDFCTQSGCPDGSDSVAELIQATDGDFYGTTYRGGGSEDEDPGTVFKITPEGASTTLYSFCAKSACADGEGPYGGLVQATNGTFYGTTLSTIFSLSVGLGPFVKTLPSSGSVGTVVLILGNNLTGATGVSFNGTAARFTVVSDSEIHATVPAGATTGKVQVITPSGTLSSNVPFRVTAPGATSTAVASSLNPSAFGQSVTFTATVNSEGGTPTGTVTFKNGSSALGAGTLSSGKATFTTSTLAVGSHSITAVYDGSVDFIGSTSPVHTQTVKQATSSSSVASSLNPSTFGAAVKFTATVTSSGGTPTGTVTFKNGSAILGTGTLSSGKATFTTSTLSVASHSITVAYGGSTDFFGSASPTLTQTVKRATSSSSVASSLNPSTFGAMVKFTATVKSSAGTPTGTVTFKNGSATLGTGTLSSGKAIFTTSTLSVASHSITAVYGGSTDFAGSTSPILTQTVKRATSSSLITSSLNPSTFGAAVKFTATVTSSRGTPTGTVTFKNGSATLGTGTLSDGNATFTISTLSVASHSITVVYAGSADFVGNTSPVLSQVVNQ